MTDERPLQDRPLQEGLEKIGLFLLDDPRFMSHELERHRLAGEDVLAELDISPAAAAHLALCRLPRRERFEADVQEIAASVGLDPRRLVRFLLS